MEKNEVIKNVCNNEYKPYSSKLIKTCNYGVSLPLFGLTSSKIEIWGLFYDETEISRGGKSYIDKLVRLCNGAYNNGILDSLNF